MNKRPRKTLPKRDSRGRFVSATKYRKPGKASSRGSTPRPKPSHPLAGQLVVNHFTGEVYTYDRTGRLRHADGKFAKAPDLPPPQSDGRTRTERMTFVEAVQFYEYDTQNLPDWVLYLVGAP